MNFHEFQAKELLRKYDIAIPEFYVFSSLYELKCILQKTGWTSAVLKVQIHAGGRGKAGGIKIVHSISKILAAAEELLGQKIINDQTGAQGLIARQILIYFPIDFVQEYYLGITICRELAQIMLIASPFGGVNIEETVKKQPNQVLKLPLPLQNTFHPYHLLYLSKFMGWSGKTAQQGMILTTALVKAFLVSDASLLEINPLVKSADGDLVILDAKLSVDDNALYRQLALKSSFDFSQVSYNERYAWQNELAYIELEGNIGCMVNGAGLAMATMDIIHHYGGIAANFLDIGGGASREKISRGFKMIVADPKVKVILINIFGGITDCEIVAAGIIDAMINCEICIPIVSRIEGTNVENCQKMLQSLHVYNVNDLHSAAQCAVALAASV